MASQDAPAPAVRRRRAGDRLAGPRRADPAGDRRSAAEGRARRSADLDAVAVANTPGLAGSLLVGLAAAKTLCAGARTCRWWPSTICRPTSTPAGWRAGRDVFPCVGLIVSGGHSNLYRCERPTDFAPLGGTIDDAAGEAFDKVASLLGLPYPGGPAIERAAETGNPQGLSLPAAAAGRPDAARLQLQRPEDGGALSWSPARASSTARAKAARLPQASRRRGGQLSRGGRRLPGRQGGAGARANRLPRRSASAAAWRPTGRSASGSKQSAAEHGYELHIPPLAALHRQRRDGRDRRRAAAGRQARGSLARRVSRAWKRPLSCAAANRQKSGPKLTLRAACEFQVTAHGVCQLLLPAVPLAARAVAGVAVDRRRGRRGESPLSL